MLPDVHQRGRIRRRLRCLDRPGEPGKGAADGPTRRPWRLARYKKAIPSAIVAVVGLIAMFALPAIPVLGLVVFLGGLSAALITAFLAGLGD